MGFQDILLHLDSYPYPTPTTAIDQAVEFAKLVDGRLTALALAVNIPVVSNPVADHLLGLSQLEKDAQARSLAECRRKVEHFTSAAKAAGVFADAEIHKCAPYALPEVVARHARTRDLCIVPLAERLDGQVGVAIAVAFDSGRPVLIYKASMPGFVGAPLRKVVIGWDGSRCAARAMADAMPILIKAAEVRVLSVLLDKPPVERGLASEALRHLRSHGVEAVADEVEAKGERIGRTLSAYLQAQGADLMVMGAYGHSRLREFILGGASEHMLHDPPTPVLLAH